MAEAVLIGGSSVEAQEGLPRVDVDHIRQQLDEIREALAPLMSGDGSGISLSEVTVELGISAAGEVGFIVAKSEVELSASISLTFSRPETA